MNVFWRKKLQAFLCQKKKIRAEEICKNKKIIPLFEKIELI